MTLVRFDEQAHKWIAATDPNNVMLIADTINSPPVYIDPDTITAIYQVNNHKIMALVPGGEIMLWRRAYHSESSNAIDATFRWLLQHMSEAKRQEHVLAKLKKETE